MSVRVQTDARGVARLTLDRAARHNAFDDAMIVAMTEALERLAEEAPRVLVLAAEGKSFCAGADLEWMRRMAGYSGAENLADAARLARLLRVLSEFPAPTVARVQGAAYGGGVGLVACCDIAVGGAAARFCLSEVRLGLIPATIGPHVVRAMGARAAGRYMLTAELFDARQAAAQGLLQAVVEDAELDAEVERIVEALLQGAPEAQREVKQLMRMCGEGSADDAATAGLIARRRASAEARAGIAAFLKRGTPPWRAHG